MTYFIAISCVPTSKDSGSLKPLVDSDNRPILGMVSKRVKDAVAHDPISV